MRYISTRDSSLYATFEEAVCSGYAPDHGLYLPEKLPSVKLDILQEWTKLTYVELTQQILRLFIAREEIGDADLERICQSALSGFEDADNAVPIRKIGGMYVAELFHGPTFCFKDFGLRALIGLLSHFASRRNQAMTLLVATTGDTGPAAVQAVSDIDNPLLTILVHYPKGQISDFQRKQLTTVKSECVRIAAFEGGGDDMDVPIKNLLSRNARESRSLTGVNSYNIGRPLMQMVHYVWAYLRVAEQLDIVPGDPESPIDFVLPTGAMGNAVGGYMAKCMGVPLGTFHLAVNVNDITHRVIQTGKFYKSDAMIMTLSEAINIQLPYNFERILYYISGGDAARIKDWMTTVDTTKKNDLPSDWLHSIQQEFRSARITDDEMCAKSRKVRDEYQYVTDPHTAVAFAAAGKFGLYKGTTDLSATTPVVLLSTASPCKFQKSVTAALGEEGWRQYLDTSFPARAKEILERGEIEPVLYEAKENGSLEESQKDWEVIAQSILDDFAAK